jgi:putative redox protein
VECVIESDGLRLAGSLVVPAGGTAVPGMVLCHGFPTGPGGAATSAQSYPELAERLSAETGWAVLTINFRGTGRSGGNFSLGGWLADLRSATGWLLDQGVTGVWLAGSSTGGALAIMLAADDPRIRGVATLAAPATFSGWAVHPRRFLDDARLVGAITDPDFPADPDAWARELSEFRPVDVIGRIPPRSVLLLHGTDDDTVPVQDARELAAAAGETAELRLLAGAGHRLRHDPRAVALLLGWMERQAGH